MYHTNENVYGPIWNFLYAPFNEVQYLGLPLLDKPSYKEMARSRWSNFIKNPAAPKTVLELTATARLIDMERAQGLRTMTKNDAELSPLLLMLCRLTNTDAALR